MPPATPDNAEPEAPAPSSPAARPWKSTVTLSETSSTRSAQSHREYLDSLVPPSREEFQAISEIQAEREAQSKRRSRELHRASISSQQSIRDVQQQQPPPQPQEGGNAGFRPGAGQGKSHGSFLGRLGRLGFGHGRRPSADDRTKQRAATVIQRTYRGYRTRREMKGLGIDASTRWIHAVREAQWRELNRPRARSVGDGSSGDLPPGSPPGESSANGSAGGMLSPSRPSTARSNWRKAAIIARRAGADMDASSDTDGSSSTTSSSSSSSSSPEPDEERRSKEQRKLAQKKREEAKERRKREAKMMGLQYFLEMVDLKHRYGANIRVYHEEWKRADTNENFFYWLDYGSGRNVDIEACPRERLDREQVRYLSREERQYYLVEVDAEGRLCWAKNGVRIDTTEAYKDSIHGIVPADDETPAYRPVSENQTLLLGDASTGSGSSSSSSSSSSNSSSDSDGDEVAAAAQHYATPSLDAAKGITKIKHVSATTLFNKLLRKSVRKNTWIFVADTSFRLYVGIKNSGAFQHSSFLQGSRISAAGLIKIKDGRLRSLSPLSGHYRPPASNFRAFVRSLKEEGVDMRRVSISKSYAVLVGLEAYVKIQKKSKDAVRKITHAKEKVVAPEAYERRSQEEEDQAKDKSESAAREREVLARHEAEGEARRENLIGVRAMRKLGVAPREPKGQRGGDEEGGERATARDAAT